MGTERTPEIVHADVWHSRSLRWWRWYRPPWCWRIILPDGTALDGRRWTRRGAFIAVRRCVVLLQMATQWSRR